MSFIKSLHSKLEAQPTELNDGSVNIAMLFASLAYFLLGLGIKIFTYTSGTLKNDNFLILFLDFAWIFNIISALACLVIWHYFHYTKNLKLSIVVGITTFVFINIIFMSGIFASLFVAIYAQ